VVQCSVLYGGGVCALTIHSYTFSISLTRTHTHTHTHTHTQAFTVAFIVSGKAMGYLEVDDIEWSKLKPYLWYIISFTVGKAMCECVYVILVLMVSCVCTNTCVCEECPCYQPLYFPPHTTHFTTHHTPHAKHYSTPLRRVRQCEGSRAEQRRDSDRVS
jgi:hypothetical protein